MERIYDKGIGCLFGFMILVGAVAMFVGRVREHFWIVGLTIAVIVAIISIIVGIDSTRVSEWDKGQRYAWIVEFLMIDYRVIRVTFFSKKMESDVLAKFRHSGQFVFNRPDQKIIMDNCYILKFRLKCADRWPDGKKTKKKR